MSYGADRYSKVAEPKPQQRRKRKTREEKITSQEPHEIPEKFEEERTRTIKLKPIIPLTEKQAQYKEMLEDPDIRIIVATGIFGTGKTFLPSAISADYLRTGQIDKIIVARPYVTTGNTTGYKPGSSLLKLYPFVRTMLDTMRNRIGYRSFENMLKDGEKGSIEVQELESIRGRSFDEKSWLILDESQQSTPEEMLSIITRISDNCKLILCGDLRQRDIAGTSGLKWAMDFFKRHNIKGVGLVDFCDTDDIVRGGQVKAIAVGLAKDEAHGVYTPQANA